ncbi:hypothetical protein [Aeromonas hydrophila]|uniref:hypothetical protein n=1 Tax=Aeromonas hydrophila TaxID=644 RepID=UPI000332B4F3|nr:hypothetical protein [Aeromonas hydrophila]AGM44480.1 hypothetical protein AHML_13550 [Aeromonas hydrophila ML09-119]AHX33146.1 hypothetical protein V428_14035 [Aeromonas hydrophila subsp. hydrophila AL09-71]AHX69946.1 hypothetical protein V429_14055 [Aeromonas hydrophila pc104A]AJE36027.1 hypothetical protein V469_09060 [Aeromonas hydrophila J-1]AKJ34284.1 hypothetical protein U876_09440 [Aeromonas hydrophila NJ-35]
MTIRPGLLALTLLLTLSGQAQAYSYAAAGKEPLIDARETLLGAATDGKDASATLSEIAEELTYLEQHHKVELQAPLAAAIKAKDAAATAALLNRAYKAEIERRLEGASQNLGDYQTAKVLVVKSKRFLDLILPSLNEGDRKAAEQALAKVLDAIGNPGVFGVGAKPADAAAFTEAEKALMAVLAPL